MSKVVHMADYAARVEPDIRPKTEIRNYKGHRYILRFDPNAPQSERWHWTVKYTTVYEYYGSASSIEAASRAAMKRIRTLLDE